MEIIDNSRKAYLFLRKRMTADVEEVWAIALSSGKTVCAAEMIFRGTVDACLVHPRDIFRFACLHNACCMIIAHNHPSQQRSPSKEDLMFTQKLIATGYLLEIPILDHLILVQSGYLSMADRRLCDFSPGPLNQWLSSSSIL